MDEQQRSKAKKVFPHMRCHSLFFQNGLNRILKAFGSEAFSFVVNEHQFESTIYTAIFHSPAVNELMLNDFGSREFSISNSTIDSNDFSLLLNLIRLSPSISTCQSKAFETINRFS
jgi:hypothetical protein